MRDTHPYRQSEARFLSDIEGFETTVAQDAGLYRHLRFHRPDTSMYWFDIVTWPGSLVINGDMGAYHFSRMSDMFAFFGERDHGYINPSYWGEKLQNKGHFLSYSEELFQQRVQEYVDQASADWPSDVRQQLQGAVDERVLNDFDGRTLDERGARELLDEFDFLILGDGRRYSLQFTDTWEWDLRDYDFHFLWCCHAIRWGIQQYVASKAAAA